jgi:hypothetical protein
MAVSNKPSSDELFVVLRKWVEKELRAALDRHVKAGHPIPRQQALNVARDYVREKLIQMAEQEQSFGQDNTADLLRTLADDLSDLMHELGLV